MSPKAATPILDVALEPRADTPDREPTPTPVSSLPVVREPADAFVAMIERLAGNSAIDAEKLERIVRIQMEILAHQAKMEFERDFAAMQGELPTIDERGRIVIEGYPTRPYAKLEDIEDVVRPIRQRHGFSFRARNITENGKHKTIGILSHRAGHSEHDEFETLPDDSGKKNKIQAIGSARSYGQRYTLIATHNIVSREPGFADDDGEGFSAREKPKPPAPEGFEAWLKQLRAAAEKGNKALYDFWNPSDERLRRHVTSHYMQDWTKLRDVAAKVKP